MNQEIQFFNGLVSEPSVDIMKSYKGTGGASKMDEFSEKFQNLTLYTLGLYTGL